jgi:hypothetical protein
MKGSGEEDGKSTRDVFRSLPRDETSEQCSLYLVGRVYVSSDPLMPSEVGWWPN